LPHIFAPNSLWEGRHTGYKSFRTKVFDKFQELVYQNILNQWPLTIISSDFGKNTNCIDNQKKIWWDLRLHHDTIEFRICDMSLTVEETMCIVSVIQAVAKLYKLNQQNVSFNIYRLALIKENKFRASLWH
jgi:carboxylate-amine ligase